MKGRALKAGRVTGSGGDSSIRRAGKWEAMTSND